MATQKAPKRKCSCKHQRPTWHNAYKFQFECNFACIQLITSLVRWTREDLCAWWFPHRYVCRRPNNDLTLWLVATNWRDRNVPYRSCNKKKKKNNANEADRRCAKTWKTHHPSHQTRTGLVLSTCSLIFARCITHYSDHLYRIDCVVTRCELFCRRVALLYGTQRRRPVYSDRRRNVTNERTELIFAEQ